MRPLAKDLAYAWRTLRKSPAFAFTAVLTLALGIGASTAIFSVVNAVLLRPLPYRDAERLVLVWSDMRVRQVYDFPIAPGDIPDFRQSMTLFEGLTAVVTGRQAFAEDDGGDPEQIMSAGVMPNIFSLLGARVVVGRDFVESDAAPQPQPPQPPGQAGQQPQAAPAGPPPLPQMAILSHEFWQRRYGGDRGVIGRTVAFGGGRAEIVGVLEPGFELLFPPNTSIERTPDIYTAFRIDYASASRNNVFLRVIARLKPGVTLQQAQQQLDGIAADLRSRFPIKESSGLYLRAEPMHDDLVTDVRPAIVALMGAVIFVLLISCANVANLLLVRASARERELAVRAALGGTRWGLIRQVLAESLVLALAGAALGFALAQVGIRVLLALAPPTLPRLDAVSADPIVLAFTILAGLVAAAAFGVVPALRASRPDLAEVLRTTGRNPGLRGGRRLRDAVVMAEVALSFVLLIGCGLMIRSFVELNRADPGYDPNGVLTFFAINQRAQTPDARAAFVRQLQSRLAAIPGVQGATAVFPLPLDGGIANARWGHADAITDPSKYSQANVHIIQPNYFQVMRTRLIEGRTYTDADNRPETRLAVIDRTFAAKAFPGESAVGKRLYVRWGPAEPEWLEVIGVVDRQRHESLAADGRETIFFVDGLFGHGATGRWVVRTDGDPSRLAPAVRAALAEVDPRVAIAEVQPYREFVDRAMAPTRFALALIAVFAGIAVILAAVGLYGVLSTVVRQRTAEIGVRMAFGAPRASIFQLVIGQGLRLSAAGIALGIAGALLLTRGMNTMLVGVSATDPATFASIAALFVLIASVASWLPARRAAGMDPNVALREE